MQSYDNWESVLLKYKKNISNETIFIVHSSGCWFILDFLIKNNIQIKGLILVSGFYDFISGNSEVDNINKEFYIKNINLVDIKKISSFIHCVYSDNDPYLPQQELDKFSNMVSTSSQIIKNGGHFNKDAGFIEFPELLDIFDRLS